MFKMNVKLAGGAEFNAEGDDLKPQDITEVFRGFVDSQGTPDAAKLAALADRLDASATAMEQTVQDAPQPQP
jgi:hypothetical protein